MFFGVKIYELFRLFMLFLVFFSKWRQFLRTFFYIFPAAMVPKYFVFHKMESVFANFSLFFIILSDYRFYGVNFYVLFGILLLYFLIIFSFKLWHHPFHFLKFHKWRQFPRTLLLFLDFSPYFSSFIRIFYEITDFWHHK